MPSIEDRIFRAFLIGGQIGMLPSRLATATIHLVAWLLLKIVTRIAFHTRIHIKPLIRTYILRQSLPITIATHDLLPLIIVHLPRLDLVRVCQASRLCFEVASRALYGDLDGVLAGKERYYHWGTPDYAPPRHIMIPARKQSLLAGLKKPEEYDVSNPDVLKAMAELAISPWPLWVTRSHPFQPSKLKVELLQHIRHLIYATDTPREFDTINSTTLFPRLHTLTIQQVDYLAHWSHPFLSNLRPKHIRLIHLTTLRNDYTMTPFPLASAVGSLAEKVTVHFLDIGPSGEGIMGGLMHGWPKLKWPVAMKQFDLVFMSPAVDTRSGVKGHVPLHSFDQVRPFSITESQLPNLALDVFGVCLSAMDVGGVRVRIIGLGKKLAKAEIGKEAVAQEVGDVGEEGAEVQVAEEGLADVEEDRDVRFTRLLWDELVRIGGLSTGARVGGYSNEFWADRWVDAIEFVTLEEYRGERDYLPF